MGITQQGRNMITKEQQTVLDKAEALDRLLSSPDYKLVFETGYFQEEAMRLPLALTNDNMQEEIDQRLLNGQLVSIGHLANYLNGVQFLAARVKSDIKQEEQELIDMNKATGVDDITGDTLSIEGRN